MFRAVSSQGKSKKNLQKNEYRECLGLSQPKEKARRIFRKMNIVNV